LAHASGDWSRTIPNREQEFEMEIDESLVFARSSVATVDT